MVQAFTKLITDDKRKKAFISKEERQIKIVMAVLKVVHGLNISPEMQDNPVARFKDFIATVIVRDAEVNAIYERVRQSRR